MMRESQAVLILRSSCSSNSAAKSSFRRKKTNYSDNRTIIPNPTKYLLDPASLPLWCDLAVLPEIPLESSDKEHEHLKYATTFLGQQEFNFCGLDNVILLQDVPLVSKSGGYLMSLSSCQTKVRVNANTHDEIFAPIQAIPSTFLLFLNTASMIEENQLPRADHHPSEIGELIEFEVTFDFLEAESILSEIWTTLSENITLKSKWGPAESTVQSSEEVIVASEALKSEKHEQVLLVIKYLAEKEAREINQLLAGLTAIAFALIGSYIWLAVSILKKKKTSITRKKMRYFDACGSPIVDIKTTPTHNSLYSSSAAVEQMGQHLQTKESVAAEDSAIVPDLIADNDFSSSETSYIDKVIIIQSRVRRTIACNKVTGTLAFILQLQSIFRGYRVRSRLAWFKDRMYVAKQKESTHHTSLLVDVLKVVAPLGMTNDSINEIEEIPPVHSIVFDCCQESFDGSTEDEGEKYHVQKLEGISFVSEKPSDNRHNPNDVAIDFNTTEPDILKVDITGTQSHTFVCDPQQASSKLLHSNFSLELNSLLISRRRNNAGGNLSACFDDKTRTKSEGAMTESASSFECHLVPSLERSHSLSQVHYSQVYPNMQELSPTSKVAEQWTMSKDTRRKNRRPSNKGFIAPLSHPLSSEHSVEIVTPIPLKVYGDRDNDNKTIFESKEPNKCPSLSLVLSGCSHGGSLLCPTSGSEAEESFLQDYW